jgi:alpha-beta hydrolase superfamily lysophospholipase
MPRWIRDTELGDGFCQTTLKFEDDYDGPVTATLVRNHPLVNARGRAVLYIHGFIDYFFQRHVAARFNDEGYDFYGLDLRKYGRSLGAATHPNFCKDFSEYFAEIERSIEIMSDTRHADVVLMAHSTGAIPSALYAKFGSQRDRIARMIFNSPFLAFKEPAAAVAIAAALGRMFPFARRKNPVCEWYGPSLHASRWGEWVFNTDLKPIAGFDAFYGWIRAVVRAQDEIARGLGLHQRILVLHSDRSRCDSQWSEALHFADLILDVKDIARCSPKLGKNVVLRVIPGGKHDLVLSREPHRNEALGAMIEWLAS